MKCGESLRGERERDEGSERLLGLRRETDSTEECSLGLSQEERGRGGEIRKSCRGKNRFGASKKQEIDTFPDQNACLPFIPRSTRTSLYVMSTLEPFVTFS